MGPPTDDPADPPASRRRGRGPSDAKTAATRRALVHAALEEFLVHGFSETRMSDVAERAGLAKGTPYRYFPDKTSLFAGVVREVLVEARAGRPLSRPRLDESTRDFLRRVVPPVLRELQTNGRFRVIQLVVTEGPRFPELAQAYRAVVIEPGMRLVRLYAARAERRGELRSDALSRLPLLLAAPIILTALWNDLFGKTEPLDAASVFETYLGLLFGEAPGESARSSREGKRARVTE